MPDLDSPDVDNLCKLVMDSLQGLAFPNDKQVVKTTCSKAMDTFWPCNGVTIFKVKALTDELNEIQDGLQH